MKPVSLLVAALLGATAVLATTTTTTDSSTAGTVSAANTDGSSSATSSVGSSPLDALTEYKHEGEWHMKPVKVVQARVQSDTPIWVKDRFVSSYGNGDLEKGYLSGMDSVNTASVEGALMYVQAECINVNGRALDERCKRKSNVRNIVFYEIQIVNSNESIAEYQATWNVPEYGPMVPIDTGRCTPIGDNADGSPKFPPECKQYNGVDGQPNVGPVVGAGIKEDEPRAPYPGTYWFSFPNTCILKPWGNEKTETCRANSRMGLCPIGKAPDGVTCTFAYDILGWVTIDDVVGITNITNPETNKPYLNFTEWCNAKKDRYEFKGDIKTGVMDQGATVLPFWEDPLDRDAIVARAQKVVDTYNMIVAKTYKSSQIDADVAAKFKPLVTPAELRKANPPCYQNVKKCNEGFGCARQNYSQICVPCTSAGNGCVTDKTYKYPTLKKAPRTVADSDTTSGSQLGKSVAGGYKDAASSVVVAVSVVLVSLIAAFSM